uniref:Uncharacterized protein n=1 Tax=viral metagenome TaxID=1070528 RepID=A0A6M3LK20_9ZZZZ
MNNILYFIDYDEERVVPLSGDADLVKEYELLTGKADMYLLGVYNTKEEMYEDALEWSHQTRSGAAKYKHLSREEMEEKIKEALYEILL